MNSIQKVLIIFPLFILGCQKSRLDVEEISPKFNSLNMNIYSNKGVKIYSIKSPLSSYDRSNQVFYINETTIELFNNNEVEYIVNSEKSTFSNLNKTINLNGNVYIKSLFNKDSTLKADNFSWHYESFYYLLNGNVRFEDDKVVLISDKAIFDNKTDVIEFFNPVKYIIKDKNKNTKYEINSENAFYNIYTKSVNFTSTDKRVRSKFYF